MSNQRGGRSILAIELLGIPFIFFLGSFLHFTFELSGYNSLVGAFSAVNESTWEHLKLCYWPAVAYAVIEHRYLRDRVRSFFLAKAVGIYVMPSIIVSAFYLYTSFMEGSLLIDISIFFGAIVAGQLVSYKLLNWREASSINVATSITAITILGSLFILFTFYPPPIFIFQDPVTGGYGIQR